jgi:hypothetical protein
MLVDPADYMVDLHADLIGIDMVDPHADLIGIGLSVYSSVGIVRSRTQTTEFVCSLQLLLGNGLVNTTLG